MQWKFHVSISKLIELVILESLFGGKFRRKLNQRTTRNVLIIYYQRISQL